jgi:hypothetical protein
MTGVHDHVNEHFDAVKAANFIAISATIIFPRKPTHHGASMLIRTIFMTSVKCGNSPVVECASLKEG